MSARRRHRRLGIVCRVIIAGTRAGGRVVTDNLLIYSALDLGIVFTMLLTIAGICSI